VVSDDAGFRQLLALGVSESQLVSGGNASALAGMLEAGEIDLWATGDLAGRHQVLKSASDPDAYEPVFTLAEDDLYFVFDRDVPEPLVAAFQRALERVQNAKDARGVSAYEEIAYRNLGVGCARPAYADQEVTDLVDETATSIEADAAGTLRRINAGEAPFQDTEHADLYAFVYDTNLTMIAHPNAHLVGASLRGKTDVAGTPFRDEIMAGALANGTGWEEYVYTQPGRMNLYHKATYYRLATGSDGTRYVVCAGTYRPCT
jgi:polar amino acid transport system substrate-binding protein